MAMLGELSAKLVPLSLERDGIGLVDREAAEAVREPGEVLGRDKGDDCLSEGSHVRAPAKKMKLGRPTTSLRTRKRTRGLDFAPFAEEKTTKAPHARFEATCLWRR
jgi:hypothetical protein